jgi:GNAT superfamily N-acetyltransferase
MPLVAQHPAELPVGYPLHLEELVTLASGERLWLRPIVPTDAAVIAAEFALVDDDTVYRRFFNPSFHLTEDRLRYLTEIDYTSHVALAAMTVEGNASHGIAIGRFTARSATDVEGAIVVKPEYRRRGVAGLLLSRLVAIAAGGGYETMSASYLAENRAAGLLLAGLGFEEVPGTEADVTEVVLRLTGDIRCPTPG